jgi:hypothetical protein
MKQRIFWINLLLVAAAVWLGWLLRANWLEARQRERDYLNRRANSVPAAPYQAQPAAPPAVASSYAEVALRTLFSRDRNPNVIVDPPPPPPPPPPVPEFPKAYGVMDLGDGPMIFLSVQAGGRQRPYKQGAVVGPWKIVAIDVDRVTLEWTEQNKTFVKTLDELKDRGGAPAAPTAANYAPAASETVTVQKIEEVKPTGNVNGPGTTSTGSSVKLCNPGDTSPAGAVVDGYRKVVTRTPFGEVCRWEPVQ